MAVVSEADVPHETSLGVAEQNEPAPIEEFPPQAHTALSTQAMRALVRLNEQRIMLDSAGHSLKILSRARTTLMWIVMWLFMWNWMELEKFDERFRELRDGKDQLKCDHRLFGTNYVLDGWYTILICITPIGRLLHADCVLRRCCRYEPDTSEFPFLNTSEEGSMSLFPETVRPGRPLRVQLLTASFLLFHVGWSVAGIYWCCQDDPCRTVNPRLAFSIGIMCVVMIIYVTLSQLSRLQVARFVDLISQDDAERATAAAAARMAACQTVELDSRGCLDGEQLPSDCAICMDALLDESAPSEEGNRLVPGVCKTPCGHVFHASCLQSWAARSGTCPLCRCSLSEVPGGSALRLEGPNALELQQLLSHLDSVNPARAEATRWILGVRGAEP